MTYVIGITGAVASGKSTFARKLADEFRVSKAPDKTTAIIMSENARTQNPTEAEIVQTDGFIFPYRELEERGLLGKKGFPESHDVQLLRAFLQDVQGRKPAKAPLYSHATYDRSEEFQEVDNLDVLIIEGVGLSEVTDLLDDLYFLDTPIEVAKQRYLARAMELYQQGKTDPASWYARFTGMSEQEFEERANQIWDDVNLPNYMVHILPMKNVATRIIDEQGTQKRY